MFLDFFWKKIKLYADASAQSIIPGINECLAEISERLRRMEIKQKETNIQLEEIDDFLQGGGAETALIDALVELTDTVADFYFFTAKDEDTPLYEQARMMWNRAKSAAEAAGLRVIDAGNEPFDFRFHSAESVEQDLAAPDGYVIKTLKSGYIYKDEVLRRAAVIINKIEKNETSETADIIYL
jgi:molecular chaperone GrpE (heat shock protein)